MITLREGDCREVLATMEPDSIDACVCDPPYGLKFMGHGWDHGVPGVPFWAEVLRVLKPGAHLLAFGGARTYHRLACAIEDAGFEVRDQIMWLYGSGFNKKGYIRDQLTNEQVMLGWGGSLKPAHEPILLARKPMVGTVAGNMTVHGTGALNIDGCRVASGPRTVPVGKGGSSGPGHGVLGKGLNTSHDRRVPTDTARWPANVAHDGSDEVLQAFARFGERSSHDTKDSGGFGPKAAASATNFKAGAAFSNRPAGRADSGTAARFFFCGKATREERGEGNNHPTVKPLALMRWLCRLITPPGGTILDPFLGSGSTALAADQEGFHCIGVDLSAEYLDIARRRIAGDAPLFNMGA